jgi:hypothetical protein
MSKGFATETLSHRVKTFRIPSPWLRTSVANSGFAGAGTKERLLSPDPGEREIRSTTFGPGSESPSRPSCLCAFVANPEP